MLRNWMKRLARDTKVEASVSSRVDDRPGWVRSPAGHDYDPARVQELYLDALTAWRKNPIAWRIIAITTDYVVGDAIRINSPHRNLDQFIQRWWGHPQNRMDLRLESLCDELSRSGDLFLALFRNPLDGMSYLRGVTKDRIVQIVTAENDWEVELEYYEQLESGGQRIWLSPAHPEAAQAEAVMLHYAINRPLGALLGEGDLTSMIPWLLRYSRMLEDRVRLHWAVRAFLWIVTVPGNRVGEKQEQYRTPPEAGSIIIKDESESWNTVNPSVHGADAQHDLKAVRGMIDAGSGYPPHWRGEAADANLATASAMQAPTERHLLRRQQYFVYILEDLLYQAYQRAVQIGRARPLAAADYRQLFEASLPDISRTDNEVLARAGREFSQALTNLSLTLKDNSPAFRRLALQQVFKFAGIVLSDQEIEAVIGEKEGS